MRTAKTLIRLGGCPGWSESSLDAHAILLVLSWGGSFINSNFWQCNDKTNHGQRILVPFSGMYTKWACAWQNQQNDLRAQWRLRSAWAPAQSYQSSLSAWRKLWTSATHRLWSAWHPLRLIWVFAGRTGHFVGFVMLRLKCPIPVF